MEKFKAYKILSVLFLSMLWNLSVAQVSFGNYALTGTSIIDANHKIPEPHDTKAATSTRGALPGKMSYMLDKNPLENIENIGSVFLL